MDRVALEIVTNAIDAVADGRPVDPLPVPDNADQGATALVEAVNRLIVNFHLLGQFSASVAKGQLDEEAPPKMHLLGPLKSLQASLRHLTWQTQEVAAGNLNLKVDFLGEFSAAFNRMTEALQEKRRAEHDALQASKLASIGQLAAGIAHEINTPTQYVGDNLQYVGDALTTLGGVCQAARTLAEIAASCPQTAEAAARFQQVAQEADLDFLLQDAPAAVQQSLDGVGQIGKIVLSMKDFSHPGATHKIMTDINRALEGTLTVSRNAWKHSACIERHFAEDLPQILCHAGEVNQVFLNLILNGAQAIEGSGKPLPGRMDISTMRDGDHVVIRVSDSGAGVPSAIRERIFDPFFTTKEVGKGTGQGLAICRDVVVTKHGGTIEVGGEEGEGAVFTVRLPIDGGGVE